MENLSDEEKVYARFDISTWLISIVIEKAYGSEERGEIGIIEFKHDVVRFEMVCCLKCSVCFLTDLNLAFLE